MKDEEKRVSDGLNEIFEIINAKGDVGEIEAIIDDYDKNLNSNVND